MAKVRLGATGDRFLGLSLWPSNMPTLLLHNVLGKDTKCSLQVVSVALAKTNTDICFITSKCLEKNDIQGTLLSLKVDGGSIIA